MLNPSTRLLLRLNPEMSEINGVQILNTPCLKIYSTIEGRAQGGGGGVRGVLTRSPPLSCRFFKISRDFRNPHIFLNFTSCLTPPPQLIGLYLYICFGEIPNHNDYDLFGYAFYCIHVLEIYYVIL